jgi:dolichol-phosphate mannosyltransferase
MHETAIFVAALACEALSKSLKKHLMQSVSIVVPVYNESGNIMPLYESVCQSLTDLPYTWEIIFVDDGSYDQSLALLKQLAGQDLRVKYLRFSRNFGQQVALCAGLQHSCGELVVTMDADLQDPPSLIPQLLAQLESGYDVAYAQRASRQHESLVKKVTAHFFYRIFSLLALGNMPLDTGDFRAFNRKVADALMAMPEKHKFLRAQIAWLGYKQIAVPYKRQGRHTGKTHYSWPKMLGLALDAALSFSGAPIRFVTITGFLVSSIAFMLVLYTYYIKIFTQAYVPGWASLMVAITFIGGVQLISLGIIGEYISRIFANVKNRPLYMIDETNIIDPGPSERRT